MGFMTKTDYFGLNEITSIQITDSSENKSTQVTEAVDENGWTIATNMSEEQMSPNNSYVVIANTNLSAFTLGKVTTISGHNYMLNEVTIATAAGSAPTIQVAGQQVEDTIHLTACQARGDNVIISGLHHAQLLSSCTVSGTGAHVTGTSYKLGGNVSTATVDNKPVASDLTAGKAEITITIVVSDSSYPRPTVTPSEGWVVTSPLTLTNADASYPSYSITLTKYLTRI